MNCGTPVQLAAPSHKFHGPDVRALTACVESPTAGVDGAASALLDQLATTAGVPGVLTGFVHVDSIPDPYTAVVTDISRLSADRFDVEVHGYYWAVLLTDGHLERLGGVTRVLREAPCARIEQLDTRGQKARLCVLTESPLDLDADRVIAWREFLQPVLRTGYPTGWEEIGQRRTPLHRPHWLFEGDPAPRLIGFSLEGDRGPTGPQLSVEWSETAQDPEWPTCWLYPGPAFDRERHPGVVNAVVNAWFVTGVHGRLFAVDGVVHRATAATWDTDDDGVEALVWQVDPGSCDPKAAIERLAAAIGELAGVLGGDVFDRLRVA